MATPDWTLSPPVAVPGPDCADVQAGTGPGERLRRRILVSAFAASPIRGSEPAVGWNIPLHLAAHHDITVLCTSGIYGQSYEQEIAEYLREHGPVPGLDFHFVHPPRLSWWLQRENGISPLRRCLYYRGYAAWQRAALHEAQRLHRQRPFDLVHHLSIVGYREPGYLWQMGIPFVWGPVGGAINMPLGYLRLLRWRDRVLYSIRNAANTAQMHLGRRCVTAGRHACHIWATNQESRRMITGLWGCNCEVMLESGTNSPAPPGPAVRTYDGTRPLRLAWSGAHIGRKALPILLHALARIQGELAVEVVVLGDGPETVWWKELAGKLGVDHMVRWSGQLPRNSAVAEVARADVFVSTSLQEETSLVVSEALALGLPVVCHAACGMDIAVTDHCGIKVAMAGPAASISGFAGAIAHLARDPAAVRRLSAGAIRRAEELTWESKAWRIAQAYDRILSPRACSATPQEAQG